MHAVSFPLFHGTSTTFIASILEYGLGGHDPVAAACGVECLKRLVELADEHLPDQEAWALERMGIELMVQQRITNGGMNFRHGAAYCSASEATAVRYALSNSHGSELLSNCVSIYCQLLAHVPTEVSFLENEYPTIHSLVNAVSMPLLIMIENVSVSALRTERGSDAAEQIRKVDVARGPTREVLLQQCNFELSEPVPPCQLVVYSVVDGELKDFNCSYELALYGR